jgi:hypothetical protein
MPIASSAVVDFAPQKDGRVYVREQHLDSFGADHSVSYLSAAGLTRAQANAACSARDAGITAQMTTDEITANIAAVSTLGANAVITFRESTVAQNAAAVRAVYKDMSQLQAVFTGEFLSTLTNGQLQTAFGLTAGQVTTLRTNTLTPAANVAASIRLTAGA